MMRLTSNRMGAAISAGLLAFACGGADERTPAVEAGGVTVVGSPAPDSAVEEGEVDEEAVAIVRASLTFLETQSSMSVTIDSSYDAVQESGEKLEFGATRQFVLRRPDRLRVETEPREGGRRIVQFDGQDLTVYEPEAKAYAQLGRQGDVDSTIDFVRDDLSTPLPLADLFRNKSTAVLDSLTVADLIGTETVDGKPCEHIFLRNADVDAQFWLLKGEQPVPLRVVLLYRTDEGQPAFRAHLTDWKFGVDAPDALFTFQPPPDAERILFAVEPVVAETEDPK